MNTTKVAISINKETLERLDRLVNNLVFANRSRAIQEAIEEKLTRLERMRLVEECMKLDPAVEKVMAEEVLSSKREATPR